MNRRKEYAVRLRANADHYLSDEARLDKPSFWLTTASSQVALFLTYEGAMQGWATFFNRDEGEVVKWTEDGIWRVNEDGTPVIETFH